MSTNSHGQAWAAARKSETEARLKAMQALQSARLAIEDEDTEDALAWIEIARRLLAEFLS